MLSHHSHHLNHGADFKAFPIGIFTPILPPKTYLLHFQLTFFYTCFFTLHGKTNLVQFSSHISISNLPDYYIQNLPGSFQSHTALPNYSPPQLLHGELLNHGSLVPSIDSRNRGVEPARPHPHPVPDRVLRPTRCTGNFQ